MRGRDVPRREAIAADGVAARAASAGAIDAVAFHAASRASYEGGSPAARGVDRDDVTLVAELAKEVSGDRLERDDVPGRHVLAPAPNAGGRRSEEPLLVGLLGHVDRVRVREHVRLEREPGERADRRDDGFRIADELLVAHLVIPSGTHATSERARVRDLLRATGMRIAQASSDAPRYA